MSRRKLLIIVGLHVLVLLLFNRREVVAPPRAMQPVAVETVTFRPPPKPKPKPVVKAVAKATPQPKPTPKKVEKAVAKATPTPPPKVEEIIPDYREELSEQIQLLMRLPEAGLVKVLLTLHRSGKVIKVEVVDGESEANRQYVAKMLPQLYFHPFGKALKGEDKHTFPVTLCGDA